MARFAVRALAMVTGTDEDTSDEARRQLLARQEAESPARRAWVGADRRGNVVGIANPAGYPSVSTQATLPGPGAGQGLSGPLFPTLGS